MKEEEFEKQQLEQLISDLKDIDKYTSFKNGAFIYDLGKYQGSLLVNHINNLQSKIDKANKILDKHFQDDEGIVYKITGEYVAERNEKFIEELRDILKENKI